MGVYVKVSFETEMDGSSDSLDPGLDTEKESSSWCWLPLHE